MMASEEHMRILTKGVKVWNDWRRGDPYDLPDLSGAQLSGMDLRRYHFTGSWMVGADMRDTNLSATYFGWANLNGANLAGANLVAANFENAEMRGCCLSKSYPSLTRFYGVNLDAAEFRECRLLNTDFSFASLRQARFAQVTFASTVFNNTDLRGAEGLESCQHEGPSSLDTATMMKSGVLPTVFLRGAGVPEQFVTYMRSLVSTSIDFYSCFISHSHKDDALAQRLHADLQDKGVRCWFALDDMKIGDEIRPRIDESIRIHDKLLLVLSEHSISSSWVKDEVEAALEKERRQSNTVLFPITLDDAVWDSNEAWAAKIRRERHIGDFRQWKDHDDYMGAFGQLLRDLKVEGG